jgi:hypothetical protein
MRVIQQLIVSVGRRMGRFCIACMQKQLCGARGTSALAARCTWKSNVDRLSIVKREWYRLPPVIAFHNERAF